LNTIIEEFAARKRRFESQKPACNSSVSASVLLQKGAMSRATRPNYRIRAQTLELYSSLNGWPKVKMRLTNAIIDGALVYF
jgi:hypothetical protein